MSLMFSFCILKSFCKVRYYHAWLGPLSLVGSHFLVEFFMLLYLFIFFLNQSCYRRKKVVVTVQLSFVTQFVDVYRVFFTYFCSSTSSTLEKLSLLVLGLVTERERLFLSL